MMKLIAFISVCILHSCCGCTERDRLIRDLMKDYLSSVEPDPTPLKAGLALLCSSYDKSTSELTTTAWEKLSWTDKRLSWNPKDYSGISSIHLPSKQIWVPDIKLYNTLRVSEERDYTTTVITSDGTVLWIPVVRYKSPCAGEEDGSGLSCKLKVGSWTYDADILKLELYDSAGIDVTEYMNDTCPLAVESATATVQTKYYPCCKEPYSNVLYDLRFKPQRK